MRNNLNNLILAVIGGVLITIFTHLLAVDMDPMERWHEFAKTHENWELDELPLIAVSLVIYVFILLLGQVRINQGLVKRTKADNRRLGGPARGPGRA